MGWAILFLVLVVLVIILSICFCCGKPYAHAGLASERADRRVGRRTVLSQTVLITG